MSGLYATDPVELATRLFWALFGASSLMHPQRPLRDLDKAVAVVAGLDLSPGMLGMVNSTMWMQLQPYVLDTVAIWTTARVAATRASGGENSPTYVYLLRRGEQLLRSADPVTTLRGWLPAEPDLR